CYMRHPGRVLEANEIPPPALLSFIADQLGIDPGAFAEYRRRDQPRREQLADLMTRLGYRSFDRATSRGFIAWLTPIAQNIRRPDRLVEMLLEELRRQRVLLPVPRVLEMLVHQARTRAEQVSYHALAEGLTETQLDALDTLLAPKLGTALSGMAWVRQ